MTDATITITKREKSFLEAKAKSGWKCFYLLRDDYYNLNSYFNEQRAENRKLIETIKSGGEVDLTFLKKQFVELYEKVGEATDCPVCFETLTKDNMEIPNCSHLICKDCKGHICSSGDKKCPICRVAYFIKPN